MICWYKSIERGEIYDKKKILAVVTGISLLFGLPSMTWAQEELPAADTVETAEESTSDESSGDTGVISIEMDESDAEAADAEENEQAGSGSVDLDTGTSANAILSDKTVLDQIYLESVALSGLNAQDALTAVENRIEEITGYKIMLHMDDQVVGVSAKELGVSGKNQQTISHAVQIGQAGNVIKRYKVKKDLEENPIQLSMQYQVDAGVLQAAIEQYCLPLNREAVDYSLIRENGEFQVVNGQRGVTLKEEESVQLALDYLTNVWKDGQGDLELAVELSEPRGSVEELQTVSDVLGQGSTDYSASSAARRQNIENGTQKLNGKVLYPGDSISVCNTMMPFSEENGYELAPSYANGTVVESFGGGICQVSTTLYLAVLRSELEVTERHNHSMIVTYVKPSMDAAIAEGSKDFQFVNNLETPIYIEGYAGGGSLGFVIYGQEYRAEDRTVAFESETLETIDPTTELVADTEKNLGSIEQTQGSHVGYVAKLWKVVTENGQETREEVNNSNYQMSPNKYKVGVKTSSTEASSAIYTAIGTNDLNQVYIVLNQYT
ncbi:MAG: hypothetical protein EOM40_06125 [Clostridia bacterium]|nr:hypothetical protein [Clostridia bacterium]